MELIDKFELMAPASNLESLRAAIQGGADSVYFGLDSLNMRNRSGSNFTIEDLDEIAKVCKESSIKAYLTLNTVMFDSDMDKVREIIDAVKVSGIDAVIASDHAVMNYARKAGVTIHISTQCNITNIDTVEFYSAYSDVMVMARELKLEQVAAIAKEIEKREITGPNGRLVRLEVFGHGALCMSVSGKCYLSLDNHGASANRGACAQNCRRKYVVTDKDKGIELEIDNEYIMSAKDLCTIDFLDKVIDAGVKVLKIEGRGRSTDYVYTVTQCYREAIDAYYSGDYSEDKFEEWKRRLATVFNRGFWDGYYLGRKLGEWSNRYGSAATQKKAIIGRAINYYQSAKAAAFRLESQTLAKGDEILITGPTTGIIQMKIDDMFIEGVKVESVAKGDLFTIALETKVRPSDKLFKIIEQED